MRIHLNNISHDFAGTVILTGITATITTGQRIGIIGPNGGGKTTLLRILVGELDPISGTVAREAGTSIGYVSQSMTAPMDMKVADYLLADIFAMRAKLAELEEAMGSQPERLDRILEEYAQLRDRYDAAHGDSAEDQATRLLAELGLSAGLDQELKTLSGGEQNVVALARAVVSQPDLLILDEPGNHLDFAGLAWLEEYLRDYRGAVVVVSHNRYLLDQVAQTIWELDRASLTEYTGNYSDYRFARLSQALSDQATYNVQQKKLARLEELVRTFEERARVTGDPKWGKRLRARRTQLEKTRESSMDRPQLGEDRIEVAFDAPSVRSDIAIDIREFSIGFGERTLLDGADLTVHVGERVGIVGPNGSGKTTMLEELIQRGDWENPVMRIGPSMRVGYCAQKRDRLPADISVQDAMLKIGTFTRHEVFGVLGRLRFEWDDLLRPVGQLSGGEWNRLQLGMAIIAKANLLILDEPTNHLDIPSREAVEEALEEFDGTVLAVSHDRYFLDAIARRIVELSDRKLQGFDGSFSEFWFSRHPARDRSQKRQRSELAARGRNVRTANNNDNKELERTITELERQQAELEERMNKAFADGDYREGRKAGSDLEKIRNRIEELYERWV